MTERSGDLEGRDAFRFIAAGHDAVTHEGAVAGGVALDCAGTEDRDVVFNDRTGFCRGHGADVAGHTHFLDGIEVMGDTVTLKKNGDVNGCRFPGDGFQVAETAHDVEHLVLVEDDDALGEFLVVTAVFVGFESRVQKFCDVLCDEVILFVGDPQVVAAET